MVNDVNSFSGKECNVKSTTTKKSSNRKFLGISRNPINSKFTSQEANHYESKQTRNVERTLDRSNKTLVKHVIFDISQHVIVDIDDTCRFSLELLENPITICNNHKVPRRKIYLVCYLITLQLLNYLISNAIYQLHND